MNKDIRQSILEKVDHLDDLQNLCYTDQLNQQICSDKLFWIHWYKKQGIRFPGNVYHQAFEWIEEYKHIEKLIKETNILLEQLNDKEKSLIYRFVMNEEFVLLHEDEEAAELSHYLSLCPGTIKVTIKKGSGMYTVYYTQNNVRSKGIHFNLNKTQMTNYLFGVLEQGFKVTVTPQF